MPKTASKGIETEPTARLRRRKRGMERRRATAPRPLPPPSPVGREPVGGEPISILYFSFFIFQNFFYNAIAAPSLRGRAGGEAPLCELSASPPYKPFYKFRNTSVLSLQRKVGAWCSISHEPYQPPYIQVRGGMVFHKSRAISTSLYSSPRPSATFLINS